jgi:ABC-type glycerol-3-phosphate transport system substrate-binding protein
MLMRRIVIGGMVLIALAVVGCAKKVEKVKIEAFYPLTEGHEWVQKYAKEIEEKYPTQVEVVVYDVTTDKGAAEWEKRGLTCGVWQINGETVFQRSEAVGGWKKPELLEAVKKAVEQAKGGR